MEEKAATGLSSWSEEAPRFVDEAKVLEILEKHWLFPEEAVATLFDAVGIEIWLSAGW